jgi:hypothetical protein
MLIYKLQSTSGYLPNPNGLASGRYFYGLTGIAGATGTTGSEQGFPYDNVTSSTMRFAYKDFNSRLGYTGYTGNTGSTGIGGNVNYKGVSGITGGWTGPYNTVTFNAMTYGYSSVFDTTTGRQYVTSDNIGYQHFYRNSYTSRLNISPVWCPIYGNSQNYTTTGSGALDSDWTVNHLGRAAFQDNAALLFGPVRSQQQINLGNSGAANSMKYLYGSTYLLSDLNNFCNTVPNLYPLVYRLGSDTQTITNSLGVSNILIFNKKLTLDQINYLSMLTQSEINVLFPKNN